MRRAILAVCGLVAGAVGRRGCLRQGATAVVPAEATAGDGRQQPDNSASSRSGLHAVRAGCGTRSAEPSSNPGPPVSDGARCGPARSPSSVVVHYGCEESYLRGSLSSRSSTWIITDVWDKEEAGLHLLLMWSRCWSARFRRDHCWGCHVHGSCRAQRRCEPPGALEGTVVVVVVRCRSVRVRQPSHVDAFRVVAGGCDQRRCERRPHHLGRPDTSSEHRRFVGRRGDPCGDPEGLDGDAVANAVDERCHGASR